MRREEEAMALAKAMAKHVTEDENTRATRAQPYILSAGRGQVWLVPKEEHSSPLWTFFFEDTNFMLKELERIIKEHKDETPSQE